jgi:nuclear transport factor 2 (NTF2) superfamily protein
MGSLSSGLPHLWGCTFRCAVKGVLYFQAGLGSWFRSPLNDSRDSPGLPRSRRLGCKNNHLVSHKQTLFKCPLEKNPVHHLEGPLSLLHTG